MDDSFLRKVISDCCSRIIQLKPLGPNVTVSLPSRDYRAIIKSKYQGNESVILTCNDNILIWNTLIHCICSLSHPLIPFELIHEKEITLDIACFLISNLSSEDKQLLESILNAINIILFPDLRSDVEEVDSYISEESDVGAYFPHIVNTIGMAICRPVDSTYMSITHKQGFDEIGMFLTLLLDNRRWLFSTSTSVFETIKVNSEQQWITEEEGIFARALSTTTTIPSKSLQKDECRSIIQSGIQTIEFTPFTQLRSLHAIQIAMERNEKERYQIESSLQYSYQFITPQSSSSSSYMSFDKLSTLLGNAVNSHRVTSSIPLSGTNPEENLENIPNKRCIDRLTQLENNACELASLTLQAIIRRKNIHSVYQTIQNHVITELPKEKLSCFSCCKPKKNEVDPIDYSCYFCESDWEEAKNAHTKTHSELAILIHSLQLQLCEVEKRLTNSNKVQAIKCNSYLVEKYTIYHQVLQLFYSS